MSMIYKKNMYTICAKISATCLTANIKLYGSSVGTSFGFTYKPGQVIGSLVQFDLKISFDC